MEIAPRVPERPDNRDREVIKRLQDLIEFASSVEDDKKDLPESPQSSSQ